MKKLVLLFFILPFTFYSQNIPLQNQVDWTLAGLKDTTTNNFLSINVNDYGFVGDGFTPNDLMFTNILTSFSNQNLIINFPTGTFLFNSSLNLRSNIVLKGTGSENTILKFDQSGTNNSISAVGNINNLDTAFITQTAIKDNMHLVVSNSSFFSINDWIIISQNDASLVTSNWALNTVGQIVQISDIQNNVIYLDSPLRSTFSLNRLPYIRKLEPLKNIGVECLKILRIDNTAPQQTSNIYLNYVVNSWVQSVESENCTFSHIDARFSSNISIKKSFFHHAFEYGSGGRAYGVMFQSTTNECLVEDNIFQNLRHSMILQSGANGNVFSYNYSFDPFWDAVPNNSAGEIVLHGNYPYANLFENNICQNIRVDNSHGPNGPHNTFFRNRAEGYGIYFSASNSPNQNIVGNEITNNNFPYNLVNYTINGSGHFIYGNNDKGTISPSGTDSLPQLSYAYFSKPYFVSNSQWGGIGTPNQINLNSIPAYYRVTNGSFFSSSCGNFTNNIIEESTNKKVSKIIDVLGRECKNLKSKPIIFIYNDGSVEKKIFLE